MSEINEMLEDAWTRANEEPMRFMRYALAACNDIGVRDGMWLLDTCFTFASARLAAKHGVTR